MRKKRQSLREKANPDRINNTLLGGIETRVVHWFVDIAPDWVNPDMMTLIGMLGSICTLVGYILSARSPWFLWLASFGFFLNWFGDSTDGNMARIRHIERPRYGYFVDHSLDTITMLMVFLGIGFTPYVRMDVALLTLIAYLMMNIYVYVNTQVHKKFQLSFAMLGPTEGRLTAEVTTPPVRAAATCSATTTPARSWASSVEAPRCGRVMTRRWFFRRLPGKSHT